MTTRKMEFNENAECPKLAAGIIDVFKELTGHFVHRNPELRLRQAGYRRVIEGLVAGYSDDLALLPSWCQLSLREGDAPIRVIADYISGLTERKAINEYACFMGIPVHDLA